MVSLHQRGDPLRPRPAQSCFYLSHQRAGDALPAVLGVDRQAIDVPSPAIEPDSDTLTAWRIALMLDGKNGAG